MKREQRDPPHQVGGNSSYCMRWFSFSIHYSAQRKSLNPVAVGQTTKPNYNDYNGPQ